MEHTHVWNAQIFKTSIGLYVCFLKPYETILIKMLHQNDKTLPFNGAGYYKNNTQ